MSNTMLAPKLWKGTLLCRVAFSVCPRHGFLAEGRMAKSMFIGKKEKRNKQNLGKRKRRDFEERSGVSWSF